VTVTYMADRPTCSITHSQIAHGTCPHCGHLIATESTTPDAGAATPGVRWNLNRMLEDLDRDDEATRLATIFNLSDHLPPLHEALPVLRKAHQDQSQRVRDRALTTAVRLGACSEEQVLVETCESLLRTDLGDLAALHVLLGFYATAQARSELHHKSRHALILRLIDEMPDVPDTLWVLMKIFPDEDEGAFEQGKALWLAQTDKHPDNLRVLGNASFFFRLVDEAVAGKLLRRCKSLEPGNPLWSRELGNVYAQQGDARRPESNQDWGLMSLAELENAWHTATGTDGDFLALMRLPSVALQAGEIEKARQYAERLLIAASQQPHEFSQISGDRAANMALGWYALYKNDPDDARSRLLSARAPTVLYFNSCYCFMDPLMKLVSWMLDRSEREAVLEYLRRDQALVPEFRDRLVKWSGAIERGLTPDFQDRSLLAENLEVTKKLVPKPL
jgi:hypothetical protein